MDNPRNNAITDVPGITVGHATNMIASTGCTVVLCENGAVAGVDVRGSAPGTRETDAIRPMCLVPHAHAVLLTGGSAFGLDAAGGVMQYLEERGRGFSAGSVNVPIVPAAVIFDLHVGDPTIRPDKEMGYRACLDAHGGPVVEGSVGAGTGATVGKYPGTQPSPGGVGTASIIIPTGVRESPIVVGAIVVVNALGNVVDPKSGRIVAGAKNPDTGEFVDIVEQMMRGTKPDASFTNTTIGVVATNAAMNKEDITKIAQMAHDGLAMSIRPVHTLHDGDTIFALSTGDKEAQLTNAKPQHADVTTLGAIAADIMAKTVVRAVTEDGKRRAENGKWISDF